MVIFLYSILPWCQTIMIQLHYNKVSKVVGEAPEETLLLCYQSNFYNPSSNDMNT